MPDALTTALLTHGTPGLIIAILIWALFKRDGELTEERKARIEDAKGWHTVSSALQDRVTTAVFKLTELFEELQKRGGPK